MGFYDTLGSALDIAVAGNYVYVADGGSDLWIINVSIPSTPSKVGSYDTPNYAQRVVKGAISRFQAALTHLSAGPVAETDE